MKPSRLTAKGLSETAKRKAERLALLPPRLRFTRDDHVRIRRGFISVKELEERGGGQW